MHAKEAETRANTSSTISMSNTTLQYNDGSKQQESYRPRTSCSVRSFITIIIHNLSSPILLSANRSNIFVLISIRLNLNNFTRHTRRSKVRQVLLTLLSNIVLDVSAEPRSIPWVPMRRWAGVGSGLEDDPSMSELFCLAACFFGRPRGLGVFATGGGLGALGALGAFGALGSFGAFGAFGSFGALGTLEAPGLAGAFLALAIVATGSSACDISTTVGSPSISDTSPSRPEAACAPLPCVMYLVGPGKELENRSSRGRPTVRAWSDGMDTASMPGGGRNIFLTEAAVAFLPLALPRGANSSASSSSILPAVTNPVRTLSGMWNFLGGALGARPRRLGSGRSACEFSTGISTTLLSTVG
ncbi:hypothetical protein KCU68_g109, partial [Aureobasidium melanogenum]